MTTDTSKSTAAFGNDSFAMAGTQGTGLFIVLAVTDLGRVGFRDFSGNGDYRVRVEPLNDDAAAQLRSSFPQASAGLPKPGSPKSFTWKVPGVGGQNRFSTETDAENLKAALKVALTALLANTAGVEGGGTCLVSAQDVCPAWAKDLVTECLVGSAAVEETEPAKRERLIKRVRDPKLPGCNACSRWSTATLESKVAAADAS